MLSKLAPSLVQLRSELDARWPHRNHGIDGWWRACRYYGTGQSDHCTDANGWVHAIDVDKRGIDAEWLFRHLMDSSLPTHYVIWDRRIANRDIGPWRIRAYHGTSNPHTDHVHISIRHTVAARNFQSGWGVARGRGGFGDNPAVDSTTETPWDYRPHVANSAARFGEAAIGARGVASAARWLRGF